MSTRSVDVVVGMNYVRTNGMRMPDEGDHLGNGGAAHARLEVVDSCDGMTYGLDVYAEHSVETARRYKSEGGNSRAYHFDSVAGRTSAAAGLHLGFDLHLHFTEDVEMRMNPYLAFLFGAENLAAGKTTSSSDIEVAEQRDSKLSMQVRLALGIDFELPGIDGLSLNVGAGFANGSRHFDTDDSTFLFHFLSGLSYRFPVGTL